MPTKSCTLIPYHLTYISLNLDKTRISRLFGWSWRAETRVSASLGGPPSFYKQKEYILFFFKKILKNPLKSKNRLYFGSPPGQSVEIRRLFLDFGLSKSN
jgi:hypothetical protein